MTQKLTSDYRALTAVDLPSYGGRRLRAHAFGLGDPQLPDGYHDYLSVVHSLTAAAGAHMGTAFLTVDESEVQAGQSQRRPRPHVDGCYRQDAASWGHSGGGGGWAHGCNRTGSDELVRPDGSIVRMSVIVASSVPGCKAWRGTFYGDPANDGDLSHIADQLGEGEIVPANVGYLLSPDCVHESMIQPTATRRTFMRIALPIGFRFTR